MRALTDKKLVIASHNQGKIRELRDLLDPLGYQLVTAGELDLEEPEETGLTFEDNAKLKALAASRVAKLPALSDDSGLAVDAHFDTADRNLVGRRDRNLFEQRHVRQPLLQRAGAGREGDVRTSPRCGACSRRYRGDRSGDW